MTTMAPPRGAPPPAAAPPRTNGAAKVAKVFGRSKGRTRIADRVLIYGTGGIGKSSLAAMAPGALFADLERSTEDLDVERADGIETWADLRSWIATGDFTGVKSIVIDSITKAEEWCVRHVVETVKTEKGNIVNSIEGYGFGKGYVHVFEEFRRLLADLERHYFAGRNVVFIGHERTGKVPNPNGEDYIRWEPRLQNSDRANIMLLTKEWCDHIFFVSYDVVAQDGKAKGNGSRAIYSVETATYMAKTRTLDGTPLVFAKGNGELWDKLKSVPAEDVPPM